ncbi:hypothetical protein [Novosphingobium sp. PY1]|uniref:Uncharacterized protein n=1 Tax=Ochrobactrum sp. PW1 TaxID=1882222 RepID=A0A292GMN3_9HYPH|nr:hypothetical protein [Novosphingobium sp. PY1]BBA74414.1 hypothetical protein [Ochrobactrum sp. PW1]GFM29263.1 uncharacterized protein PY1_contig-07-189 [Novosphingobium sp. PY1]
MSEISREDAEYLLARPEFRRFLFAAIQSAGLLAHEGPAHGPIERDLSFIEGRRSLGFEILQMVEQGQPEALRTPGALATISAAIREAMNPDPKERTHGPRKRRDPYAELSDE